MKVKQEWFGVWFDSPFYHILYKNRDNKEAKSFIDNLTEYFHFEEAHKILDLACGKGRHSIYLNSKGFDVEGVDLSPQNIAHAKDFENSRLKFYIHDMRDVFAPGKFDYILNMFTSFGYFESESENEKAICAAAKSLKPGGKLLIDFLNPYRVVHQLVPREVKTIEDIDFEITKWLDDDGFIIKDIQFYAEGKRHKYQEKVKAIQQKAFLRYFEKAGLKVVKVFGGYSLEPYSQASSDRMIFVVEK